MKTIEKDLLTVERGILCHQVNCRKVMGSGIAKSIKEKWPIVFDMYISVCETYEANEISPLGYVDCVEVGKELYVANLFGQESYGSGKRFTSYAAWEQALPNLKAWAGRLKLPVYFPYNVGCDRGGANFIIISEMIKEHFPDAIFCKLPE